MKGSGRPRPASSALILSLLISLLTTLPCLLSTNTANASPAIVYTSKQMIVNGTQTLTVSGDCDGPYTWAIVSGAGGLSNTEGASTTYTAPSANAECALNPTITLSCGGVIMDTLKLAVAHLGILGSALALCNNRACPPCAGCPTYICCWQSFNCYNVNEGSYADPNCTCVNMGPPQKANLSGQPCSYWGFNVGLTDLRTSPMKTQGCCPAGIPPEPGNQTNDTGGGDQCSSPPSSVPANPNADSDPANPNVDSESAANLKSGNLYFSQDMAGLRLAYNSISPDDGPLGKKWTHRFNEKLTALSGNDTLTLRINDGDIIYFHLSGGIYYPEAISGDTSRIVKNVNNTYTRTLKNGTAYEFNTAGRLTSITDRNGNTTTLTYSGSDLAGITDPNNRTTIFGSSGGKITAMTDPAGRTYNLAYTSGLLTSITDPLNNIWHYTYDTAGRMLTKTDPASHTVTYTYDTSGRLLTSTDPNGKTRSMTYTQTGTTALTEKDGGIWTYQYDPTFAVKTQKTDPLGNISRYTYNAKRNLTSVTDPDGGITRYTYDGNSNVISVTDTLNHTTTYTYNALNLIASRTDPRGGVTTYGYDAHGNLTSTTDPAGTTAFQYDAKGNITAMTDADNRTTVLTYDAQNNLTSIADPLGHTTIFTYDAVGNRLTITDPLSHVTSYVYNALNQMTQVTDFLGHITHFTYDYQDNILTTTDANNKPTGYEYNYRGQLTRITDALNHITQMSYGPTGCGSGCGGAEKLASLTDALNHVTGYIYDLAGRMVTETDPKGQEINSTYDARGNIHTRTKPDGRTITYTYDAANRLTQKQYPGGSLTQYQYDANGNMTYAANSAIAYNFTYDANNRLTQVTDSNAKTIQYQYSAVGKRTAVVTPENKTIAYTYDSVGRPATVASEGRTFTFAYDAANRRTSLASPNGTAAAYTYDNNGNLTQIRHTGPGSTVLAEVNHTYDAVNNRLTRTDNAASGTESAGTEMMTYNTANELLGLNTATYGYDPNGNRILRIDTGGSTTYSYDDENRLIRVETTGSQVITYAYDPFGRRIEKNVNGTITRYLYDREDILLEYDQAGTVAARYLHGPGIDEPLAVEKNGQMYYYQADGLGSVIALTDSAGAVVQSYQYDAFGNMLNGTPTIMQPYTVTAREYDSETGLYYYRARHYDPVAGRFLQRDPIGFAGGDVNLYAYVFNNPIKYSDPLGLDTFMCAAPLHALGKYGPKVYNPSWYNPLYHQFICVNDSSGSAPTCGSQDRSGNALWSDGKPGNDHWPKPGEGSCRKVDTRKCVDECSKRKILNSKRPKFGIGWQATDCQEWADDSVSDCQRECEGKK